MCGCHRRLSLHKVTYMQKTLTFFSHARYIVWEKADPSRLGICCRRCEILRHDEFVEQTILGKNVRLEDLRCRS